jgi:hypothetical protein
MYIGAKGETADNRDDLHHIISQIAIIFVHCFCVFLLILCSHACNVTMYLLLNYFFRNFKVQATIY